MRAAAHLRGGAGGGGAARGGAAAAAVVGSGAAGYAQGAVADEKWWEVVDLEKVDLSMNAICSVPEDIGAALGTLKVPRGRAAP